MSVSSDPLLDVIAEVERHIGIAPPADPPLTAAVYKRSARDFIVEEIGEAGDVNSIHGYRHADGPRPRRSGYVELTLVKEGLTTDQAVRRVARALDIPPRAVSYAGLKDAKAITAQAVRIPDAAAARLGEVDVPNVRLTDPRPVAEPLRVGQLWGNYFTITLQPVDPVDDRALALLRSRLARNGVPNFFDVQRFGRRLNLHDVGRWLAKGDEAEACRHFVVSGSKWEASQLAPLRAEAALLWPDYGAIRPLFARHRGLFDLELQLLSAVRTSDFGAVWRIPMIGPFSVRAWVAYLFNGLLSSHTGCSDLPLFDGSSATEEVYAATIGPDAGDAVSERARRHLVARTRPSRAFPVDCFFRKEGQSVIMGFALEKGVYATSLLRSAFRLHAADTAHITLPTARPRSGRASVVGADPEVLSSGAQRRPSVNGGFA